MNRISACARPARQNSGQYGSCIIHQCAPGARPGWVGLSERDAGQAGHGVDVFVATAGQIDQNHLILAQGGRQLGGVGQRVAGFQRGMIPS